MQDIFLAALDRGAKERAAFLDRACADDRDLRREVESLLAAHETSDPLLDRTVGVVAAQVLAQEQCEAIVGQAIGAYRVERQIGRGGMGEVYLARDTRLDRPVAIKLLPASFNNDTDRVRRFQQEARAASLLNHPNIVTIHEIGEAAGRRFIVTEFVEGKTLRLLLRAGAVTPDRALDIVTQVASALNAAHQAGIIHRDIKPENVMARADGYVKVLDFGLAKLTGPAPGPHDESASELSTESGTVMGTVKYMSPEQARGQKVDQRTDIFSLGVVFYELLTGRAPFEGETPSHTIVAILEREPPPLTDYLPDAPAPLRRIIEQALHKAREARYQTVGEMLGDLGELRQELQLQARQERAAASGTSSARGRYATAAVRPTHPETIATVRQSAPLIQTQTASLAPLVLGIKRHRLVAALALIPVAVAAVVLINYYGTNRTDSLAVLPFTYSGNGPGAATDVDAEYLSDGMTETLISNLSQMPRLKVIARSSVARFKGKEIDPRELGRLLDVRAILIGRVIQRGERLAVSVELVDTRNDSRLWGNQYDIRIADLQPTQREIARAISAQLGIRLTGEQQRQIERRDTGNGEAYELYIKGRYCWNKRTDVEIKKGIEYYRQAIAADPNYALAYAGLAESFTLLPYYSGSRLADAHAVVREMASKALAIDERLAEPHAALAMVCGQEWNWSGALDESRRAIELNPNYATAHQWNGLVLARLGRFDEALAECGRARELDPISGSIISALGTTLYYARRYDRAIQEFKKGLELVPDFSGLRIHLSRAYEQQGMHSEALAELQKAAALTGGESGLACEFAYAHARSGNRAEALRYLQMYQDKDWPGVREAYAVAKIFAALGDKDQAFGALNQSFEAGEVEPGWIKVDPQLDNLRDDARFDELLKRAHLAP